MNSRAAARTTPDVARLAGMMAAMGTASRLRIMRLLLAHHPQGLVVGDIQAELGIHNATLSHHLQKLKQEGLVNVVREGTFLRHVVDTEALRALLGFLYAECCGRSRVVDPEDLIKQCRC